MVFTLSVIIQIRRQSHVSRVLGRPIHGTIIKEAHFIDSRVDPTDDNQTFDNVTSAVISLSIAAGNTIGEGCKGG